MNGHYQLKDRAVTALAFAAQPAPTDLQALQMADAVSQLTVAEPEAVVPVMQALANQLNVAVLDAQMSSLGSALAASQAFVGAGSRTSRTTRRATGGGGSAGTWTARRRS